MPSTTDVRSLPSSFRQSFSSHSSNAARRPSASAATGGLEGRSRFAAMPASSRVSSRPRVMAAERLSPSRAQGPNR